MTSALAHGLLTEATTCGEDFSQTRVPAVGADAKELLINVITSVNTERIAGGWLRVAVTRSVGLQHAD